MLSYTFVLNFEKREPIFSWAFLMNMSVSTICRHTFSSRVYRPWLAHKHITPLRWFFYNYGFGNIYKKRLLIFWSIQACMHPPLLSYTIVFREIVKVIGANHRVFVLWICKETLVAVGLNWPLLPFWNSNLVNQPKLLEFFLLHAKWEYKHGSGLTQLPHYKLLPVFVHTYFIV